MNLNELLGSLRNNANTSKFNKNKFTKYHEEVYSCKILNENGYIINNALYIKKGNNIIEIVPQIILESRIVISRITSKHKFEYQLVDNINEFNITDITEVDKNSINNLNIVEDKLKYEGNIYKILDIKKIIKSNGTNGTIDIKLQFKKDGKTMLIDVANPKVSFNVSNSELKVGNSVNINNRTNTIKSIDNINGQKYATLNGNENSYILLSNLKKTGESMLKTKKEIISPIITKEGYFNPTKKYTPGMRVTFKNKGDKLYYIKSINAKNRIELISKDYKTEKGVNENGYYKEDELTSAENIKEGDIVVLKNVNYKTGNKYKVTNKYDEYYTLSNKNGKETIKTKDQIFKIMTNPTTFVRVEEQKKGNNIIKKSMFGTITGLQKHARVVFKDNEHTNQLYYIDSLPDSKHVRLYSKNNSDSASIKKVNGVYNINSISSAEKIEKGDVVIIKGNNFKNLDEHHQVTEVKGNICTLDNGKKYTSNELFKIYSAPKKSTFLSFTTKKKNLNNIKNYITYKGRQYTIEKNPSFFSSKYILKNLSGKTIEVTKKEFENGQKKEAEKRGSKGRT
jgi:hypothetical protein